MFPIGNVFGVHVPIGNVKFTLLIGTCTWILDRFFEKQLENTTYWKMFPWTNFSNK